MTATISLDGQSTTEAQCVRAVEGHNSVPVGQRGLDAQGHRVGGDGPSIRDEQQSTDSHGETVAADPHSPHPAMVQADTVVVAPGGVSSSDDGQRKDETQSGLAGVAPTPGLAMRAATPTEPAPVRDPSSVGDHYGRDHQRISVTDAPTPGPANAPSAPKTVAPVRGTTPPAPAIHSSSPKQATLVLADPLLALAADVLDDLEKVRISNENRLRQLTRSEEDADGEERGFGLTLDHPDVKRLAALVQGLADAEHQATLNLGRQMRAHPIGPWVKASKGIGEKQGARLLAAIGDPYWNDLHERPRTVSELWAYCGYHVLPAGHSVIGAPPVDASGGQAGGNPGQQEFGSQKDHVGVAAVRTRGTKSNWSADAKMRAYLIAVSVVKAGGPYREVYDATRAKYVDALHQADCKRCGPKGKPALIGSPLSDGHKHARALRAISKAVLKDLWREAKRLHEEHV